MALVVGSNSYVSVAEADAYFEDRVDVAAWIEASELQKAQSLVTATSMIDEREWIGVAVSDSQLLAFPRHGSYFDTRLGLTVQLSSEVPKRIKVAVFEQAYHLLNNDGLLDDAGAVDSLKLGNISLDKIDAPRKMPDVVYRQIRPLLYTAGKNAWWRAN